MCWTTDVRWTTTLQVPYGHVLALLLAVFRIDVDDGLPKRGIREIESRQPELLDLPLPVQMICEEIARHGKIVSGDVEVPLEERHEEADDLGI
jgi:hypothetical protein